MLLAISGLEKQNLILSYDWLKDHNPKIDWEKKEVEMTCCPLQCEGGRTLQKEQTRQKRTELRALWLCRDGPTVKTLNLTVEYTFNLKLISNT